MSGIYIPGMEMPTVRDTLVLVKTNGTAIVYEDEAYVTTAIPIPPHGRLIDADDFFRSFPELIPYEFAAKTIIPAEEGEG